MKASTSSKFQTVTDVPNLKGLGNLDSLTQRQIVAGLTGSNPGFAGRLPVSGVLASSEILMTLRDIAHLIKIRYSVGYAAMRGTIVVWIVDRKMADRPQVHAAGGLYKLFLSSL